MSKKNSIIILTIIAIMIIGLVLVIVPLNGEEKMPIGDSEKDWVSALNSISLGLDLRGGMYAEYATSLFGTGATPTDSDLDGAVANLESILFGKGYTEATVMKLTGGQIRVEVPNIEDTSSLMKLLGQSAELTFQDESGKVWINGSDHLKDCYVAQNDGAYVIKLEFNAEGTKQFAEATEANQGKTIKIFIDDEEIMAPTVNAVISDGNAIIEGNYTYETANAFAVRIKAGATKVRLSLVRSETISPTLGDEALSRSILAGVIGVAIVCLLMVLLYKGLGLASAIALMIYVELLIIALAIVPWVQLTLPGIAGVILSIGMAVDANVVIFERIKDERMIGNKLIPSAINSGFKKAFISILDANVTTILGSIIMIIFGSTAIKSFAITLLIGVILSLFSAIMVTRLIVNCFAGLNSESEKFYGLKKKNTNNEEKEVANA